MPHPATPHPTYCALHPLRCGPHALPCTATLARPPNTHDPLLRPSPCAAHPTMPRSSLPNTTPSPPSPPPLHVPHPIHATWLCSPSTHTHTHTFACPATFLTRAPPHATPPAALNVFSPPLVARLRTCVRYPSVCLGGAFGTICSNSVRGGAHRTVRIIVNLKNARGKQLRVVGAIRQAPH